MPLNWIFRVGVLKGDAPSLSIKLNDVLENILAVDFTYLFCFLRHLLQNVPKHVCYKLNYKGWANYRCNQTAPINESYRISGHRVEIAVRAHFDDLITIMDNSRLRQIERESTIFTMLNLHFNNGLTMLCSVQQFKKFHFKYFFNETLLSAKKNRENVCQMMWAG